MSISDITHDAYQVFPQQCLLASVLCDEKSMVMYTSYVYTIFVVSACPPCFLSLFFFSDFEKAFSINTPRPLYQKRSTASPSPSSANSLSLSLSGCISPVLHCPQTRAFFWQIVQSIVLLEVPLLLLPFSSRRRDRATFLRF